MVIIVNWWDFSSIKLENKKETIYYFKRKVIYCYYRHFCYHYYNWSSFHPPLHYSVLKAELSYSDVFVWVSLQHHFMLCVKWEGSAATTLSCHPEGCKPSGGSQAFKFNIPHSKCIAWLKLRWTINWITLRSHRAIDQELQQPDKRQLPNSKQLECKDDSHSGGNS